MTLALLLISPLLISWTGYGEGLALWSAGRGQLVDEGQRLPIDVIARVRPHDTLHVEATLPLRADRGDGVMALYLDDRLANAGRVQLPHPGVEIRYREYDLDGEPLFIADIDATRGYLNVSGYNAREIAAQLDLRDARGEGWRRFELIEMHLRPVDPEFDDEVEGSASVAYHGEQNTGCDDDDWDDGDYEDDDYDSSGGGCEGDDLDEGSSDADPGGGCEGDDFDSGSSSPDSGGGCDCEGDAVAARRGVYRRSPWIVRALNWAPWLSIYLFIQLLKRRRRGSTTAR